ncbi:hypothetical protein [Flavobacterium okayamense]|uniref:Uncharacterized protein n=1 Tax=Flavobacterium okayamense TaxID=2830782 RepID=A0ABN6I1F0_9FLAO|nr:hypothetical protein [Flavobacterium okayamense]BCY29650.1 hypothetical protein KK2020170_25180 [Flavobacterium okayamense]
MAGEGAMSHAIQSLKFNRAQKRSQRRDKLNFTDYHSNHDDVGHDPIKSTPEQLEAIRLRMQAENKKRKKTQIILAILSFVVAIFLIYVISNMNWIGVQPNF